MRIRRYGDAELPDGVFGISLVEVKLEETRG